MEQGQRQFLNNQFPFIPFTITPFPVTFHINTFTFNQMTPISFLQAVQFPLIDQNQNVEEQGIKYFISFFSPKETAKALQRRNQNLESLCFEDSGDQQPDDVYNRRKKKVSDLMTQQQQQLQSILEIKRTNQGKYNSIIQFVKFFCKLKQSLPSLRIDYYSSKTFCAIKNTNQSQMNELTKVVKKMYENISNYPFLQQPGTPTTQNNLDELGNRTVQFLIIPRFLISKQKIIRLIRDQQLQSNFQFLVIHTCLGHYNNEANKKMPEEKHMKYVRQLLGKKLGREKFKKICSINHGNKFSKSYGGLYYELYSKSLSYLQYLDNSLKKGKKFESIKKQLQKMSTQGQDTVGNSSVTENDSSNGIYSFKSIKDCLNKIEKDGSQQKQELIKEESLDEGPILQMEKPVPRKMIKKMMSTPIQEEEEDLRKEQKKFKVRKFKTMQQNVTQNIILVRPPRQV